MLINYFFYLDPEQRGCITQLQFSIFHCYILNGDNVDLVKCYPQTCKHKKIIHEDKT